MDLEEFVNGFRKLQGVAKAREVLMLRQQSAVAVRAQEGLKEDFRDGANGSNAWWG